MVNYQHLERGWEGGCKMTQPKYNTYLHKIIIPIIGMCISLSC